MSSRKVSIAVCLFTFLLIFGFALIGFLTSEVDVTPAHHDLVPNSEECNRVCREHEHPRTCYYHFTLEYYTTMGRACGLCKPNNTNQLTNVPHCQCIEADGFERGMLSINRMLPGPSIQVCQNDKIIVDVHNAMIGMEAALHWHGIMQRGSQYYDGVPFITQCPILSGTTFRYQFVADSPGTHFYHSHAGVQKIDGQYGSLIVRQALSVDPHGKLYDQDLPTHVILLSDWMHEMSIERFPGRFKNNRGQTPDNLLINGKGRWKDPTNNQTTSAQLETFLVQAGKRYRFRMINSFGTYCSVQMTVEGHSLSLIAQDGESVVPVPINTVVSSSGERVDFILYANQTAGTYWIQVLVNGECDELNFTQVAMLRYVEGPETPNTQQPDYEMRLEEGIIYNPLDAKCDFPRSEAVCVSQLEAVAPIPEELLKAQPDHRIILPYNYAGDKNSHQELFKPGTYPSFMVVGDADHLSFRVDGISFVFPRVPPLSQNLNSSDTCSRDNLPQNCGEPCHCPHTLHIMKNAIVEVVVYDTVPGTRGAHSFHLHGHSFHILKMGILPDVTNSSNNNIEPVLMEHQTMLDSAQYRQPAGKDTVLIAPAGYAILRFKADNPGWWLFHCHLLYHIAAAMSVIFHVGEKEDLPPIPPAFPTCYSYVPDVV